ncbi:CDF family Co(II)/Ni(II) efflux transporter DmeF [Aerophototrophica crusticola]|uniref:CDF family Co(II)/Ni(II) efflux transporter DmeF n=1 Tax=Aerophototrophica crusticola TaxID=1709002 RepID=A0A858R8V1_9PROT|nr:CDF family Co(II)/Ni(II) efflux transporter DmeF [Rhodospirillaceae bacterium B3]
MPDHHDHPHPHHHTPADDCAARDHGFLGAGHRRNESRTWWVIGLTVVTMVAEIWAGTVFGSMALVADGWHMATHAGALLVTAGAYAFARRHARDPRFSFGTGKVGDLAGFASAVALGFVALMIGWESVERLLDPGQIRFGEAMLVAVLGLVVNLASAALLHDKEHGHHHGHGHHDHHDHDHGHREDEGRHAHRRDLNLSSAYFHVLADALTSVLAILGLAAGWKLGWTWMDAAVGLLGAVVIARWSWGLTRDAGANLLDAVPDTKLEHAIRGRLQDTGATVTDLHLWRLGPGHLAAVAHVTDPAGRRAGFFRERLAGLEGLSHVTVQVE